MYRKIISLILSSALFVIPGVSHALRCGNKLANVGDLKHEILLICGKPISKEIIGYIDKEKEGERIRVMIIEEWIIKSNSSFYSLVFEGNKLTKIESAGSEK